MPFPYGNVQGLFQPRISNEIPHLVSITSRVTPVPIPNTTVKPLRADDTSGEALRESKSSPVESPEHMLGTFLMQTISQKFDNI